MTWNCKWFLKKTPDFWKHGIGAFCVMEYSYTKERFLYIQLPIQKDLSKHALVKIKLKVGDTIKDSTGSYVFGWNKNIHNLTLTGSLNYNGVTIHCHIKDHKIIMVGDGS